MGRWRSSQSVEVQPPFLRPPLTEAQLEAKVLDNGIQNDRHSTRVSYPKYDKRNKNKQSACESVDLRHKQNLRGWKQEKIISVFKWVLCFMLTDVLREYNTLRVYNTENRQPVT